MALERRGVFWQRALAPTLLVSLLLLLTNSQHFRCDALDAATAGFNATFNCTSGGVFASNWRFAPGTLPTPKCDPVVPKCESLMPFNFTFSMGSRLGTGSREVPFLCPYVVGFTYAIREAVVSYDSRTAVTTVSLVCACAAATGPTQQPALTVGTSCPVFTTPSGILINLVDGKPAAENNGRMVCFPSFRLATPAPRFTLRISFQFDDRFVTGDIVDLRPAVALRAAALRALFNAAARDFGITLAAVSCATTDATCDVTATSTLQPTVDSARAAVLLAYFSVRFNQTQNVTSTMAADLAYLASLDPGLLVVSSSTGPPATTPVAEPTDGTPTIFIVMSIFVSVVTIVTSTLAIVTYTREARKAESLSAAVAAGPLSRRLEDRRIVVTASGIRFKDHAAMPSTAAATVAAATPAGGAATGEPGEEGEDDLDQQYRDVVLEWNVTDDVLGLAPSAGDLMGRSSDDPSEMPPTSLADSLRGTAYALGDDPHDDEVASDVSSESSFSLELDSKADPSEGRGGGSSSGTDSPSSASDAELEDDESPGDAAAARVSLAAAAAATASGGTGLPPSPPMSPPAEAIPSGPVEAH